MTQARLAEAVGISTFTLIRWEQGERSPDGIFLEKLAKVLGCWIILDTEGTWNFFPRDDAEVLTSAYDMNLRADVGGQ